MKRFVISSMICVFVFTIVWGGGVASGFVSAEGLKKAVADKLSPIQYGPDSRTRVKSAESTTDDPYRSIVQLTLYYAEGDNLGTYGCTGFVIGRRVIATAAHCLKDNTYEAFVEPGKNGSSSSHKPLRAFDFARSASGKDYGVIFLKEDIHLPPLEMKEYEEEDFLFTAGYPSDKNPGTMWENEYHKFFEHDGKIFSSGICRGGQSGSPVLQNDRTVFGILIQGTKEEIIQEKGGKGYTVFLPFTSSVLDEYERWIAIASQ